MKGNKTMSEVKEVKFVTRREGVRIVREQGIPLTVSRVNKDAMNGVGPEPCGKYGPSEIYELPKFIQYAIDRVKRALVTA
jgi:hypothetical protein